MPITIDEVTADVAPPERRAEAPPPADSGRPAPSDLRRTREQIEHLQQRACRVRAN